MKSAAKDEPALGGRLLAYALGHPLRARLAGQLRLRSRSAEELAEILGEPLPRVIYHCGVLERHLGIAGIHGNGDR